MQEGIYHDDFEGHQHPLENENTALRAELAELKEAAVTMYYGGLLSSEMCAKIEGYALLNQEE